MGQLDLLLVNPNDKKHTYGKLSDSLAGIEPPLWTALIAAFIRQAGFTVKIVDAEAEGWSPEDTAQEIIEYNPILLGVGAVGPNPSVSSTPKMTAVSKVLNILRSKRLNCKTFIYGIHPSALPEKTLKEEKVDFICKGECFYPILELLKLLKKNKYEEDCEIRGLWYMKGQKIISNGWADIVENLDELPFAAWDLLPMQKYRAHNWHCFGHLDDRQYYAIIYTSLGCPFNCRYCNIHALYNGKPMVRYRSLKRVIEEIDLLVDRYNVKNFKILDEIFVLREDRVFEMCDLLIQRKYDLNIWAYARVDTVNERILRKMKEAGINWLSYGIESASNKVRAGVTKGKFDEEAIKKAIKITHDAGIYVIGNFMFGLPDDNLETMRQTLRLAKELNCEYVNLYTVMAYPGSQLYNDALEKGLKLPDTWSGYSQFNVDTFPLSTKYISAQETLRFRDSAFKDYFSSLEYLAMIKREFGEETVSHLQEMLNYEIRRRLLEVDEIVAGKI